MSTLMLKFWGIVASAPFKMSRESFLFLGVTPTAFTIIYWWLVNEVNCLGFRQQTFRTDTEGWNSVRDSVLWSLFSRASPKKLHIAVDPWRPHSHKHTMFSHTGRDAAWHGVGIGSRRLAIVCSLRLWPLPTAENCRGYWTSITKSQFSQMKWTGIPAKGQLSSNAFNAHCRNKKPNFLAWKDTQGLSLEIRHLLV